MSERIDTPLTNEHFAVFCLSMLGQPYWYGTALHKCSESLRASKGAPVPVALRFQPHVPLPSGHL